jgi:uncharacterized membrane protein YfcA
VEFDSWLALIALAPITFLGALLYGLTGFGSALITVPLATHFFPLQFVIATYSVVDLTGALRVGLENPRHVVRSEVVRIVPLILLGVVLGTTALVNLPRGATTLGLGIFIAAYAVYALVRPGGESSVSQRWAYVAGITGGITGTLFGAGGPPYAIYLSHRPLDKAQYRATLTMTSVFSIGLRMLAFLVTGLLFDSRVWLAAVIAIPAAFAGITVASRVFHRISREALMRVVALTLLAVGVSLVVRSVA